FCSPSVIRKTPPSLPMSSPMSTTFGSSSRARRNPRLSALPMVRVSRSAMSVRPLEGRQVTGEAFPLGVDDRRPVGVGVVEEGQRLGLGHREYPLPQVYRLHPALLLDLGEE